MNITRENAADNLTATLKIEVVKDDYNERVTKILKNYQHSVTMPGFRPGKVPFEMIRRRYWSAACADEVQKLVSEEMSKYITDNKLNLIGYPLSNTDKQTPVDFDHQTDFDFYFDIAFMPYIKVVMDNTLTVTRYNIAVEDDVLKNNIESKRRRYGEIIEPETVGEEDMLVAKLVQSDDKGEVVENGITKSVNIFVADMNDTGKHTFLGKKPGDEVMVDIHQIYDREVDIARVLGMRVDTIKDMQLKFNVTIAKVTRLEKAEISEDFFNKVYPGSNIHSMAEFEDMVRIDLGKTYDSSVTRKFVDDCLKAVVEKYNVPLNDEFIKRLILSNASRNEDNHLTKADLDRDYDKIYAPIMRRQIMEELIAAQYDIRVTRDDIHTHFVEDYKENLETWGEDMPDESVIINEIDKFIANPDNRQYVDSANEALLAEKYEKFFMSGFNVENKSVSSDEFFEMLYPTLQKPATKE